MPAGRDGAMRTAVNVAGNDQTVPMHGCGFRKMVGEVDRHGLAAPQAQCRAQERAIVAIGRRGPTRQKAYRSGTGTEGNGTVSIRPNFRGIGRVGRAASLATAGARRNAAIAPLAAPAASALRRERSIIAVSNTSPRGRWRKLDGSFAEPGRRPRGRQRLQFYSRREVSQRTAIVEEHQRALSHVQSKKRLTNHLIISGGYSQVLSGGMDVAHASLDTMTNVWRGRTPRTEYQFSRLFGCNSRLC